MFSREPLLTNFWQHFRQKDTFPCLETKEKIQDEYVIIKTISERISSGNQVEKKTEYVLKFFKKN